MKSKTQKTTRSKRHGNHHRQGKQYKQVYWPYLPLLGISFIILVVSFLPPRFGSGKTLAYSKGVNQESLLTATNQERANNSKGELKLNQELAKAAQAKANDMVNRNYWSHQTPEGQEPWTFIDATGYRYVSAGENLAYGFTDSATTINGWMQSPTHRDNMLNADFSEAGFGFADSSNYQNTGQETVVVAMYARPVTASSTLATLTPGSSTPATQSQTVTRAQSLLGLPTVWAGLVVGGLGGSAITGLFVNHGLRLRRLLKRGEQYFVAHPLLDLSLVFLAAAAFNLSRIVGYIY